MSLPFCAQYQYSNYVSSTHIHIFTQRDSVRRVERERERERERRVKIQDVCKVQIDL